MNPTCVSCGAPLPLGGSAIRQCSFCGREQHVELPVKPTQPYPPIAPTLSTQRSRIVPWLLLPILLVVLVTVSVKVWSGSTLDRSAAAAASPRSIISRPIAVGHANGDRVLDFIGLAVWSPGGIEVTAIDGATGKPIWHVAPPLGQAANDWVYANGDDAVVITTPAPSLHGLDAKTGKLRFDARLAARPLDVTFGPNCFVVLLENGNIARLALSNGAATACTPSEEPAAWSPRHERRPGVAVRTGTRKIEPLLERDRALTNPAPDRVTIRASEAEKEIWRQPLPELDPIATEDGQAALLVSVSSGVFVLGRAHGQELAAAALLDPISGRKISTSISKPDHPAKTIGHVFGAGDRMFVLDTDGALRTYAPSGQLLFQSSK